MPCTCVNNTSCNQPKVVPELEIQGPRGKEQQRGVADTKAAGSMPWQYAYVGSQAIITVSVSAELC